MKIKTKKTGLGERTMQSTLKTYISFLAGVALLSSLLLQSAAVHATGVCSQGTGIPPFLESGAASNLLLLLDNSGSMLDMAYIDNDNQCFDETFLLNDSGAVDDTKRYAGNFETDKWYEWESGIQFRQSGDSYALGAIVQENEIVYRALNTGTSTGAAIDDDGNVTWQEVYNIEVWENGTAYVVESFVRFENQLYYSASGGTSAENYPNDGLTIDNDDGIAWSSVDSTWRNGIAYSDGDVVSSTGMLYLATTTGTASGTSVHDDTAVTWDLLDTGYFVDNDATSAKGRCTGAFGTAYSNDDLCIAIASTDVGGVSTPYVVTAFSASGNFLNWASASKFDIQKSILTGGKYDNDNQLLISENRGCAGKKFVKQIAVKAGEDSFKVTLSVTGASEDGWIDTTDDTTRIAILAVTSSGFDVTSCQLAVDEMALASPSLGQLKIYVDACLGYSEDVNNPLADSLAAFNHSLHFCWYYVKKGDWLPGAGAVTSIKTDCEAIYENGYLNKEPKFCWSNGKIMD